MAQTRRLMVMASCIFTLCSHFPPPPSAGQSRGPSGADPQAHGHGQLHLPARPHGCMGAKGETILPLIHTEAAGPWLHTGHRMKQPT